MFGSTVLEVAIGMVFVFLLVSLVCSGISDRISEMLNWRATDLENGIRDLLLGKDQKLLNQLYNSQLIQSLSTIKAEKLGKVSGQSLAAKTNVDPSQPVPSQPAEDPARTPNFFPTNIPARTFVLALFDAFVPKQAADATSVTELRTAIQAKLSDDSVVKKQLLALVTGADDKIEVSRKNVEQWFNAAEEQMTRMYRQNMWQVAIVIGLGVSVFLNVDTTAIAANLWHDPTLRAAVVAQATNYANKNVSATGTISTTQAISETVNQINSLNLPVGWSVNRDVKKMGQCLIPANWIGLDWCAGPTDWVNWKPSSDAASPSGTAAPIPSFPWISSFLIKILGWIVTAFAGAQGAPFWFDVLRKLTEKGSPPAK